MSRELLLARRLIEAAVDPYASPVESEGAASEIAAFAARSGAREKGGYPVNVEHFERIGANDLSPMAWLLLLENAERNDPMVPSEILEQLFQSVVDEVIRLRLVSGSLGHPKIIQAYKVALERDPSPVEVSNLPDCWPKQRLLQLAALRRSEEASDGVSPADDLRELCLYLLQDGSLAARALAAAAVTPQDEWRSSAHQLVKTLIRDIDPEFRDFGAPFRRARVRD